jgi:hypothetical protein
MWRHGDPLSALLFNLTLDSVIRNLEIRGNITTKLKQINAYADDIVITEYKFEGISRFTYLGSDLTENNSITAGINERLKKEMQRTIKIENC